MRRPSPLHRGLAALLLVAVAVSAAAQGEPPHKFKNLKVLPTDVPPAVLRATMGGFTRALGVRCDYCHALPQGQEPGPEDFAKDDKPTKIKAREMMKMVDAINADYLSKLDKRADPPLKVECFTCHHGVAQPRTLQDVLNIAYDQGGMDSTLARYHALHDRYYGRAAYDFSEVPLTLVAAHAESTGHAGDASQLLALNVDMNPSSDFAKRQQVASTLAMAFRSPTPDSAAALFHTYQSRYGQKIVSEGLVNNVAYAMLGRGESDAAISAFRFNTTEFPSSSNGFESLGEAYAQKGDRQQAQKAFEKALQLDPQNAAAKQGLDGLKEAGKAPAKK